MRPGSTRALLAPPHHPRFSISFVIAVRVLRAPPQNNSHQLPSFFSLIPRWAPSTASTSTRSTFAIGLFPARVASLRATSALATLTRATSTRTRSCRAGRPQRPQSRHRPRPDRRHRPRLDRRHHRPRRDRRPRRGRPSWAQSMAMMKYRSLCIAVVAAQVEVRSKATGGILFNVGDGSYFRSFVRVGRCPCEFLGARQFRTSYDCV